MSKFLKLMYITNRPEVASVAEKNGVDRIFVDMEYIGKSLRQGGMDTVQSHHTVQDAAAVRAALSRAELLVRCNPVHKATSEYAGTQKEIDAVVQSGADVIMLPFFQTAEQVQTFIKAVDGRAKTMLLFETPEAYRNAEQILQIGGIDEVYIGLNDMSLGFGKKFMFELLTDGTVETLCNLFARKGLPYGFGGIAAPGGNVPLPAERIIKEHYRLGSTCVILSRSFCNAEKIPFEQLDGCFAEGVRSIREQEDLCAASPAAIETNRNQIADIVKSIVAG